MVDNGAIAVRPTLQACLTYDHRAIDGGPAAAFLATLERWSPHCPSSRPDRSKETMEIAPETLLSLHRTMLTIRLFEQRVASEFRTGEIPGFVHMYVGEEAVAAGVCANLDDDDYVTSTHRGHGHCIAKGCDLDRMMAEIYGREDGLCKGRGGSMHIADFSRGMLGANAIVGGGIALATGAGLAVDRARERSGRGGVLRRRSGEPGCPAREPQPRGDLEAAGPLRLREQRLRRVDARRVRDERARRRGARRGLRDHGRDRRRRRRARRLRGRARAVERARAGEGPTLLEVKTYRFRGHFEGDPDRYRDDEERRGCRRRMRSPPLRSRILAEGHATEADLDALHAEIEAAVEHAVEFARSSPFPDPADIGKYVYPEQITRVGVA